jgi:lipopolysaccharide/colanic/teichoic acid biosynthesis glycosyltransferase
MDSTRLGIEAPSELDLSDSETQNGTVVNGTRNDYMDHALQDRTRRFEPTVGTENGGTGTVALPAPGGLGDLASPGGLSEREHSPVARGIKRVFDLVGSLILVAILAPAWLMIALLIRADSPGPILFRQPRIGRDGKAFSMLKFRTMVDGADARKPALLHLNEAAEGLFKIDGDPRVTRVGRWLRATCLDELPQLLHVITGKMSLVGPRPLVPEEDARIVGSERRRLSMRPGMTGVWQVGGASAVPIREMVKLDTAYADNWSLWWDVKLLVVTARLVLLRKGL